MKFLNRLCASLGIVLFIFSAAGNADVLKINGAGATFPYPIYSKWFDEYQKKNPQVAINYQSVGSGAGIRQFLEKTIDFGATDAPMTDEQLSKAKPKAIHVPTVLGAVVLAYNLPGVKKLNLSGEVIAEIYLGKIKKWNDPKIVANNPGTKMPEQDIVVAYRSDGSGTTFVFTDYLAKVSAAFKTTVGNAAAVQWPTGLGGKGNEGVTAVVKSTPGAIGYVELIYAKSNALDFASVQNSKGKWIVPTVESVTAAAAAFAKVIPADYRVSITQAGGDLSYPISSFTYLLLSEKMPAAKHAALTQFLAWALKDGQGMAGSLGYAPLPKELVKKVNQTIQANFKAE
jgi:phosphate transport system substrate-binding protein